MEVNIKDLVRDALGGASRDINDNPAAHGAKMRIFRIINSILAVYGADREINSYEDVISINSCIYNALMLKLRLVYRVSCSLPVTPEETDITMVEFSSSVQMNDQLIAGEKR